MMPIKLNINAELNVVDAPPEIPLLRAARDSVRSTGFNVSLGIGQCGTCTKLVDGNVMLSCVTLYAKPPFTAGRAQHSIFDGQRALLLREISKIGRHVIASDAAPAGVGEPSTSPIFAAATTTVFAASGARYRSLRLSNHGLA